MRFEIGYVRWGYPPPERVTALSSCLFFKWLMIPDNSLPLNVLIIDESYKLCPKIFDLTYIKTAFSTEN